VTFAIHKRQNEIDLIRQTIKLTLSDRSSIYLIVKHVVIYTVSVCNKGHTLQYI